jgi:hypothetical protein
MGRLAQHQVEQKAKHERGNDKHPVEAGEAVKSDHESLSPVDLEERID